MSTDKDHLSLPHLYGAPAHGLRRMAADSSQPPLGPDDLPIETFRSAEDQALALHLFPRAYTSQVMQAGAQAGPPPGTGQVQLQARPLLLRALAGRLLRPRGN